MAQIVERTARATKFLPTRNRAGFGSKQVDGKSLFAEAGAGFRFVVCLATVKPTIDLSQFVVHIADVEITPHPVAVVLVDFQVQLALRRREFFHRAIVAEGGVVVVRIDSSEKRLRILAEEIAEQLPEFRFAGVDARGQPPAVAEFSGSIQCKATFH